MNHDEEICQQARELIDQARNGGHEDQYDSLMQQAYRLLAPLVEKGFSDAQYLHAHSTVTLEFRKDSEREKRRIDLVKQAAHAGHARAQFTLGQMYEPDAELPTDAAMSAYWFEKSALQGYVYAQWVHGLNLLNGNGLERNEALALDFIRRAAEGRFEGAIQFMADAYASGSHGFPKDEAATEMWRRRLLEPDLMSY